MRALAAIAAASLMLGASPASACALALALALDISTSVNSREHAIQIGGLAAALRAPDVEEAILTQSGPVWIAVYEWSGWQQQDLVIDWTEMTGPEAIAAVAARLESHVRPYEDFSTATGRALKFGAALMGRVPALCARRVIDISGDGEGNEAEPPEEVWASGALNGITVNALVIEGAWPPPAPYYRDRVIGGPGAFMMVARNGFDDYPEMIRGKLLRELKPPMLLGALDRAGAGVSPEP